MFDKEKNSNGITVKFQNDAHDRATAELDLRHIPVKLRPDSITAHMFPTLQKALVSLGMFVDDNHNILLTTSQVLLEYPTGCIPIGVCDPTTKLWTIYLAANTSILQQLPEPILLAYNAYTQSTMRKLAKYLQKVDFSPVHSD